MSANFVMADSSAIVFSTNNNIMSENSALTISAWIKPITVGAVNAGRIVGREASGSNTVSFLATSTNAIQFIVIGNTTLTVRSSNNSITLNTWQHIAMTWDGSTTATNVHFYVNGVETGYQIQTNGGGPFDNASTNLRIGNLNTGTRSFDGLISDVALWVSQLSQHEISQLATNRTKYLPLQISPDTLRRYFPLDELPDNTSISDVNSILSRNSGVIFYGSGNFATGGQVPKIVAEGALSYP